MPDEAIDAFLADLQSASLMVDSTSSQQIVAADPDDDPIVATAINSGAGYLCTLDRHLRTTAVVNFCAGHGVEVISDIELLARLRRPRE
jgi:predicted nucleic acid-binding protein